MTDLSQKLPLGLGQVQPKVNLSIKWMTAPSTQDRGLNQFANWTGGPRRSMGIRQSI